MNLNNVWEHADTGRALLPLVSSPRLNPLCMSAQILRKRQRTVHRVRTLGALATDAARQLDVLDHDGDALGVDRVELRVFKQVHEVALGRLLQGDHGLALPAVALRVGHHVGDLMGQLTYETLEGQLADQEVRVLLALADLAKRDRARAPAARLLHAARGRPVLASHLARRRGRRGRR